MTRLRPKRTAQRNFTDPDSKIMKASDGAFEQSYNAQAVVDSHSQVIVVAELPNLAPDCPQLEGALDQLDLGHGRVAREIAFLGEDGYGQPVRMSRSDPDP